MKDIGQLIMFLIILWAVIREFTIPGSEKKTCRHCGERIPFNAKSCPYCRRYPGHDFLDDCRVQIKILGKPLIALILFALIYVAGNSVAEIFS